VTTVVQVSWEDVGGLDDLKKQLQEFAVSLSSAPSDSEAAPITMLRSKAPKGLLLYGAPGCSKTLLARALATEAGVSFLAVKGSELYSKFVGESEKAVAKLFARARQAAPSIVFVDEIDGLTTARTLSGGGAGASFSLFAAAAAAAAAAVHLLPTTRCALSSS
jgi:AAA family ATPase